MIKPAAAQIHPPEARIVRKVLGKLAPEHAAGVLDIIDAAVAVARKKRAVVQLVQPQLFQIDRLRRNHLAAGVVLVGAVVRLGRGQKIDIRAVQQSVDRQMSGILRVLAEVHIAVKAAVRLAGLFLGDAAEIRHRVHHRVRNEAVVVNAQRFPHAHQPVQRVILRIAHLGRGQEAGVFVDAFHPPRRAHARPRAVPVLRPAIEIPELNKAVIAVMAAGAPPLHDLGARPEADMIAHDPLGVRPALDVIDQPRERFARIPLPAFGRNRLERDQRIHVGARIDEIRVGDLIAVLRFIAEPVLPRPASQPGDFRRRAMRRALPVDERVLRMRAAPQGRHVQFDARHIEAVGIGREKFVQYAVGQRIVVFVLAHPAGVENRRVNFYARVRELPVIAHEPALIGVHDERPPRRVLDRRVIAEPQPRPEQRLIAQQSVVIGHMKKLLILSKCPTPIVAHFSAAAQVKARKPLYHRAHRDSRA